MSNDIYILSEKKIDGAINLPVFKINNKKLNIDISKYDGLIFTSKNALYSLESYDKKWKEISSYAIAPQTATIIKTLGGKLEFTGKTNHGDKFALELLELLKNKKVLYLRGAKVVSSLVDILNNNVDSDIQCDEVVVYESVCKEFDSNIKLPKNSIIIFSSPTTIECFLKNITWDKSFKAIAIGKTTAKYFPSYITPLISETTSLQSCVQKAQEEYLDYII